MSNLASIAAALKGCTTVLISTHKSPDGDALGSQLGLMLALEKMGKTVIAHNLDPVPEIYRFLPQNHRIRIGKPVQGRYDAYIVVDADPPRTGLFDKTTPADILINIDHHITNPLEWPLTWLDTAASATGEMIYKLIQRTWCRDRSGDRPLSVYRDIYGHGIVPVFKYNTGMHENSGNAARSRR